MKSGSIVVVIQARMTSARLPGKVLLPLAGRPALLRMVQRLETVKGCDQLLVATSSDPSDDPIDALCRSEKITCVRGPLDDVLERFLMAMPDHCEGVVRLTGDCPLIEPGIVEECIDCFRRRPETVDYVGNVVDRTMPDGLDVEVISRELLLECSRKARSAYDREHVTTWIRRERPTKSIVQEVDLSSLRWTLDTAADYRFISTVYDELCSDRPDFSTLEIYGLLLEREDLLRLCLRPGNFDEAAGEDMIRRITRHIRTIEATT